MSTGTRRSARAASTAMPATAPTTVTGRRIAERIRFMPGSPATARRRLFLRSSWPRGAPDGLEVGLEAAGGARPREHRAPRVQARDGIVRLGRRQQPLGLGDLEDGGKAGLVARA